MWFRLSSTQPGGESGATEKSDKFRVSSFKKRIKNGVKNQKTSSLDSIDNNNESSVDCSDNCEVITATLCVSDTPAKAKLKAAKKKSLKSLKNQSDSEQDREKDRVLLTDRKYKNNRIEKSSSKTKVVDIEKRESIKKSRSNRKISAPPILCESSKNSKQKKSKNHTRSHSNFNLNALVNLVTLTNKKYLSNEDFNQLRRKSLSEAAQSAMVVATGKPILPTATTITTKCPVTGVLAETDDSNGTVILVKHDKKICDNGLPSPPVNSRNSKLVNRASNSSIGSRNSRKLNSDEEFYTCDEKEDDEEDDDDEEEQDEREKGEIETESKPEVPSTPDVNRKKSSPSLTSRVAAKISETTNHYKNRNKTKRKTGVIGNTKRPELYKQISNERLHSPTIARQPSDRRPDTANASINSSANTSFNANELHTSQSLDTDTNALDAEKDTKRDRSKAKSAPGSVNRSESYRDREHVKRTRHTRRKISDPSPKANDEHSEFGLSNANCESSSNSSIASSGSRDGSNTSLDPVGIANAAQGSSIPTTFVNNVNLVTSSTGPLLTGQDHLRRHWVNDSDNDDDHFLEADWSSHVASDILATLTDAEKRRQEIINEIYHTERSHVRTLRLLENIFMRPLQDANVLPPEHLQLLFPPALLSLKDLHSSFEQQLKLRRSAQNHVIQNIGDMLVLMFEGQSGDRLREYAVQFCARQQIALEALKEKRRKDEQLQKILTKSESDKACRRLQLKDLLPTVLQRLTKYPLLFENLYKLTKRVLPDDEQEHDFIQRALDSSKRILVDVNQAVKTAEDEHKLQTIQRKLDKCNFEKDAKDEFKNLDLTKLKLIHDGHLTLKKVPGVQLHGLLFENMMVLLHKQDDKYLLKNFPNLSSTDQDKNKTTISPITHIDQQTLVRQSAVDKNTFFLIITKTSQMLELRAPSSSECKTWFKHISDAAEQYKPRSKNSHEPIEDPASATLPHSSTKESLENTPERTTSNASTGSHNHLQTITGEQQIASPQAPPLPPPEKNRSENGISRKDSILRQTGVGSGVGGDGGIIYHDDYVNKPIVDQQQQQQNNRSSVDSNSRLFSNNSNNTRTLMQDSQLQEPSVVQISISPVHTAEPVLTPSEKLKRLDGCIRDNLAEKQKIICDMFRVPVEHFNEIVDIAGQPETPCKDSSDIILAAYAQVQSLTEVLNDYMKITPEQEISAVSTAVCDQCHEKQQQQYQLHNQPPNSSSATLSTCTQQHVSADSVLPKLIKSDSVAIEDDSSTIIHEDDDGYCEIDELRLPALQTVSTSGSSSSAALSNAKSLPIGVAADLLSNSSSSSSVNTPPELVKRQSTISSESIPEESEQEINQQEREQEEMENENSVGKDEGLPPSQSGNSRSDSIEDATNNDDVDDVGRKTTTTTKSDNDDVGAVGISQCSEHIEINDTYDTTILLNRHSPKSSLCGPNRLAHVNSLEPTVPVSIINGYVSALNSHISQLLPKINERDAERERLKKENQHLRELLNAMHERLRVEEEKQTPEMTKSADIIDITNTNDTTNTNSNTTTDHKSDE